MQKRVMKDTAIPTLPHFSEHNVRPKEWQMIKLHEA